MRNVHIWYINQDFHLISHTKKLNKLVISGTFTSLYVNITRTWEATNKSRFNRLKKKPPSLNSAKGMTHSPLGSARGRTQLLWVQPRGKAQSHGHKYILDSTLPTLLGV